MVLKYILQQFCMLQNNPLPAVSATFIIYGTTLFPYFCYICTSTYTPTLAVILILSSLDPC